MTVEQPEVDSDLGDLSFTQSSLFNQPPKPITSLDESLGSSFLFNSNDQGIEAPSQAGQAKERSPQKDQVALSIVPSTNLEELDYRPATLSTKQFKLFNGRVLSLKPKAPKPRRVNAEEEVITGSFLKSDALFEKAELRNNVKSQEKRLEQLNMAKKPEAKNRSEGNHKVWTEKYRPTKFVELCSAGNDRQYRSVLHWLRKWSSVVHGDQIDPNDGVDSMGRPHKKILLVHGPSGIGKTAAIHILAKQLGYNVEELNAANSMDTLPQAGGVTSGGPQNGVGVALKLKIMNALTTNSITSKGRPSCLVIDEVDSSMNAGDIIRVLSDLVFKDQRSTYKRYNDKNEIPLNSKTGNQRKKPFYLNRPIICIANDIYSSGPGQGRSGSSPMDKLRQMSEIVAFKKPSSIRNSSGVKSSGNAMKSVKDHLMWINEKEKLGLDFQKIGEIVEICDGDIRACLNHLQFNGRKINLPSEAGMSLNKDNQISWFSMVDVLFRREGGMSKDENFEKLLDSFMNGSGKSTTSNSSTFDKVIRGCFNKYLDVVRFQDDSLIKPSLLSDWLSFYDHVGAESTGGDVSQYSSLVSLKVWSLFSEINPQRNSGIESLIPNSRNLDFETFEMLKQNRSVIKRVADNLPLKMKLAIGDNLPDYSTYVLPYLNKILTPEVSSKVKSNLSEYEKSGVEKVTELVKDLELKLETERDIETGQVTLQLSPNWDNITYFDNSYTSISLGGISKQIQTRRSNLFPLITSELERLSMIRKSSKRTLDQEPQLQVDAKQKRAKMSSSVDFFKGRYDGLASQVNETKSIPANNETTRIWVKYNEGFSNAVRKNIGWNEVWRA